MQPWQQMFIWVGLPGIVISLLILTIREPARREYLRTGVATAAAPVWDDACASCSPLARVHRAVPGAVVAGDLAYGIWLL